MNRNAHRIIFNQARGQSMAVPESAAAGGQATRRKRTRRDGTGSFQATFKPLGLALLWALGAILPAQAQVVAYKAAPGNLRPTVFNAGNGVPLVNIQTPSAAGVSRNQYEQLDAGPQGVIFNNSRTDVATQLGGWVQGNPWLAKGGARVILNEVISSRPSQLNGYLEIAGQRAQLVIANPAGVTCDGCGFLNANRVTLTTGTPLLNGGNLEGYRVDSGQIRIEGSGMDASGADYTDLIARAVQVNAGLWAQHLAVTAGANRVDAGHAQVTPLAGSGPAPAFAIDVAQLGGMYAGKITLIGTEAGVGVRNAGTLAASAGEVVVTATGRLENRGTLMAGEHALTVRTYGLENEGTLSGEGRVTLESQGDIDNRGLLYAARELDVTVDGTLRNQALIDGGNTRIQATTLDNLGNARIYGDHLAIAADTLNNQAEGGTAPVIAARERLDLAVGTLNNHDGALIFSAGDLAIGGVLDAHHHASGQAAEIDNASATLEALGALTIDAERLTNRKRAFALGQEASAGPQEDLALLDRLPELQFHWPISESHIATWRNDIRDRYINLVVQLLGGGPDAALVAAFNRPPPEDDIGASINYTLAMQHSNFVSVWGNLSGYTGPTGGGLSAAERNALVQAVNGLSWATVADSSNIWRAIIDTLAAQFPARIDQIAATLASRNLPDRSYRQICVDHDDDCSYVRNEITTRQYRRDVILEDSPQAVLRAGSDMNLTATALTNRYSLIQSGGDMALSGAQLSNTGAELYAFTDATTTSRLWHWGDRDHGSTVSANSTQSLIGSAPAIINAGGVLTGSFTDRIDNVTLRQNAAPVVNTIGSVPAAGTATTPNGLPVSGLFKLVPNPTAGYLLETDPAFANYRSWLSSDYMLQALSLDPAQMQKRLGDGFYEQRLITEQVAQLTGRRFLDGYTNDEAQYQALMAAGVAVAQEWQLIPGVALTAGQVAALTTDIVWLVAETVTLPDGSTQQALVPRVYARLQDGDLAPSGALLAAEHIRLDSAGELVNGGTIAGRQSVLLTGEHIAIERGQVTGRDLAVQAAADLDILGGALIAQNSLIATAGRDLTVASSTAERSYAPTQEAGIQASVERQVIDRVAGLYVTGENGTLVAAAGRDFTLLAAAVASAGDATLAAQRDLTLGTVTETNDAATASKGNRWRENSRTETGTEIGVAGDFSLQAGHDLTARAASVEAGGALSALAGHDLTLEAGDSTLSSERWHKSSKGSGLAKRSSESRDTLDTRTALATTFSGDTVLLQAGHDLTVRGSNAVATGDLVALAGKDLSIEAATQTHAETHYRKEKKSGLSSSGASISAGSQKLTQNAEFDGTSALGSTLGSVEGHVTLLAGERYRQTGSDVLAPQGDITIAGKAVSIEEARETSHSRFEQKFKQSGLTISISNPVISAIQTVQQMSQAASDTDDGRMKALAAASAGLSGYGAYSAVQAGQGQKVTLPDGTVKENQIVTKTDAQGNPTDSRDATAMDKVGGINLNISLGSSKSQSRSSQKTDSAAGSTVAAGGEVTIVASGAGAGSDLTVQGSRITGQNVTLMAEDEIKLLAAANTSELRSKNKSSSGSIGVSIGTGGLAVTASASKGKGKANGDDLVWTNTHVEAAETVTLQSGGDTTLKGAVVAGNKVQADIGGNLEIESLQDRSTYDSKQSSAGFSLSVPITGGVPNLAGIGGNVSASQSKVESDYASVTEQSGIRAGDGGFDVQVGGDTTLTGGAITSTQQAIDAARNRFETGGELTLTDIENKAEYEAKGGSINLGAGVSTDGKLKPQGTSAGFGSDSDDAQSMTLAAISDMAGNKEARTGDAETGIKPIFDADKVQKEIDAQVQITQLFGQQASKAVGDYADTKLREAQALRAQGREQEASELEAQWGANGTLRLAAHTLIGGLTGGASGAAGAAVGTLTAPAVADALAQAGIDGPLATAITALASTAAGAAVGGTAGGSTALNEVGNNYLSHLENKERAEARKNCTDNNSACQRADELDALDRQRDMEFHAACDGELRTTEGCADATRLMFGSLTTYFSKQDGKIYLPDDFLKTAHQDELQNYVDLLKTAHEKTLQNDTASQRPDLYNSDLYSIVDPNKTDIYAIVKIGDQWSVVGKTDKVFTSEAGVNGILNTSDYAPGLLGYHINKEEGLENSGIYTLLYNPTGGFLADGLETFQDKLSFLFGPSEVAKKLSGVLDTIQQNDQSVNWVAHSQGGAIFVSAVDYHGGTLSKNSVAFHAGANNRLVTDFILKKAGMNFNSDGEYKEKYWDSPYDAVPNIIGLNTVNPIKWIGSILFLPTLFMGPEWSPHTLPPKSNP